MTTGTNPDVYLNRDVIGSDGNKIGTVGQVYLDDATGVPDWITVHTGLFGLKQNFVPLQGASLSGDDLVVPFTKDVVKDAPSVDDDSHLDASEQDALYSYYQGYLGTGGADHITTTSDTTDYGTTTSDTTGGGTGTGIHRDSETYAADTDVERGGPGYDTSGPTTDTAMTRSEEQLQVGTQEVSAGRARLRKYVVTEQQSVSVPVSHEEVRLEREPITDANAGQALSGPDISEEEHVVELRAERPVVTTEAVPVERVRLDTETVTENQTVSGEVRKEQIELEDDTTGTGDRTTRDDYR